MPSLIIKDCGRALSRKPSFESKTLFSVSEYFSCSNYTKDTRSSCPTRHYIRADAVEQVVMLELRKMATFLKTDEDEFVELLAQKNNKVLLSEQTHTEEEIQKAIVRNNTVAKLHEKLYEDNVFGKVTDEWFMQLSQKYELERLELKAKICGLRKKPLRHGRSTAGTRGLRSGNYKADTRKGVSVEYIPTGAAV